MKKIILILLLILPLAYAQDLKIVKESNGSMNHNDLLDINIIFNNPHNFQNTFEIQEELPQGVTLANPDKADKFEYHDGLLVSYYRWQVNLSGNEIALLKYQIKPNNLGEYGLKPTKIIDKSDGKIYFSNSLDFIVLCKLNNICEENENSLNCPQDCSTGIKDNICDYKKDGLCDPDCTEDPDCALSTSNSKYTFPVFVLIALMVILYYSFIKKRNIS